jgi:hypothetical protein
MRSMNKLFLALLVVLTSMTLIATSVALAKNPGDSSSGKSADAPGHNKVKASDDDVTVSEDEVADGEDADSSPDNSANAPGQAKKLSKGSSDVKGNLKVSQHIYYEGDTIEVSIKFSRGWELLADGTADAYVVVISPETELLSFPVDPSFGPSDRKFFSVPLESTLESTNALPVGQYQLGLILTVPNGDPVNLIDWRNGFRGLLDMEGVLISDQVLAEDADRNGECDYDNNDNGFCDGENGTDDDDDDDADDDEATQ